MKYCSHCGKELFDEAIMCPGCGCPTPVSTGAAQGTGDTLLKKLSERYNMNGIIWLVIGIVQVLAGIFANWLFLIVGVLNIISSVQDMSYSKTILENPTGIVEKVKPLTGPIIILVYNLVVGGVIGVIGSIYYLVAIRSFVLENETSFVQMEAAAT